MQAGSALEQGAAIVRLRLRGYAWHRIGFALGVNSRTAQMLAVGYLLHLEGTKRPVCCGPRSQN